jgi:hypothetical protein
MSFLLSFFVLSTISFFLKKSSIQTFYERERKRDKEKEQKKIDSYLFSRFVRDSVIKFKCISK